MPKYRAYAKVSGGQYLGQVEADSKEDAEVEAFSMGNLSLCHECAHRAEDLEIEEVFLEEVTEDEDA